MEPPGALPEPPRAPPEPPRADPDLHSLRGPPEQLLSSFWAKRHEQIVVKHSENGNSITKTSKNTVKITFPIFEFHVQCVFTVNMFAT